jgi:hypothetical protein
MNFCQFDATGKILFKSTNQVDSFWDRYGTHMADSVSVFFGSAFHGKKILAVGAKVAMLHYALHGSHVTFVDTAPSHLEIIRRVAVAKGVESYTDFIWVESVLHLDAKLSGLAFDAVILLGSLDHIPHKLIQPAMHVLAGYLKPGGSWLQRSYPFKWWTQVQMTTKNYPWLNFQACSQHTSRESPVTLFPRGSGCSTSWAQWYEKGKLIKMLQPFDFSVKWCGSQTEFIWFELIKNDKIADYSLAPAGMTCSTTMSARKCRSIANQEGKAYSAIRMNLALNHPKGCFLDDGKPDTIFFNPGTGGNYGAPYQQCCNDTTGGDPTGFTAAYFSALAQERLYMIANSERCPSCLLTTDFYTRSFYLIASETPHAQTVTMVTQGTIERLSTLSIMFKYWGGPVSLVMYIVSPADKKLLTDWYKKDPNVKRWVDIHLFFHNSDLPDSRKGYPINSLRNLGMMTVRTDYAFLIDCDFVPSTELAKKLQRVLSFSLEPAIDSGVMSETLSPTLWQTFKDQGLIVVNIFKMIHMSLAESLSKGLPLTKHKLLEAEKNGFVTDFLQPWAPSHAPSNYTKWRNTHGSLFEIAYKTEYKADYEPFVAGPVDLLPLFDERIRGPSRDKQIQAVVLNEQGVTFSVLSDGFALHLPNAHKRYSDQTAYGAKNPGIWTMGLSLKEIEFRNTRIWEGVSVPEAKRFGSITPVSQYASRREQRLKNVNEALKKSLEKRGKKVHA